MNDDIVMARNPTKSKKEHKLLRRDRIITVSYDIHEHNYENNGGITYCYTCKTRFCSVCGKALLYKQENYNPLILNHICPHRIK